MKHRVKQNVTLMSSAATCGAENQVRNVSCTVLVMASLNRIKENVLRKYKVCKNLYLY